MRAEWFGWILAGAGLLWIVWSWFSNVRRRRSSIADLGALLENARVDTDRGVATGTLNGRNVRAELTSRGDGSSSESWTEVRIAMTCAMKLELRPQTIAESIDVKRGMAIDVIVGDNAFDAAYIIEGAPTDHVREVFADRELRRSLVRLKKCEVTQLSSELMIARKGWVWGEDLAIMIGALGTLATRMEKFGGKPSSHAFATDVSALERARAMREKHVRTRTIFFFVLFGMLILAIATSAFFHHNE